MTQPRKPAGTRQGGQFAPAGLTDGISHRFPSPYGAKSDSTEVETFSLSGARPLWGKGVTLLDGEPIGLMPFSESDIPALMRVTQDPDILRFTMMPRLDTHERAREWATWASTCPNRYAIRDSRGNLLGQVGYAPGSAPNYAEIYYWVDPSQQGRGLGTAALAYMTICVERDTGLIPELHIYCDNEASLRIARRCGYLFSGATANRDNPDAGSLVHHMRRHRDVSGVSRFLGASK